MNAAQVSSDDASEDKLFWLWWVVTTTLGWFIGWSVGFLVGVLLPSLSMLVVLAGAGVGLMQ